MQTKGRDIQGFVVLLVALLAGGYLLLQNVQPQVSYTVPAPTSSATPPDSSWEQVIEQQLADGSTGQATRPQQAATYSPPPPILFQPTQLFQVTTPTPTRELPNAPTRPGPTSVPSPTGFVEVVSKNDPRQGQFSPPPEIVPLSADPRDHFWFKRPVDASANSTSLQYYAYGSDGPQNAWRIHHGIDLPNPIGKEIRAAAAGHVIWAADNYRWIENGRVVDAAYTYGNVVIIQHDFGYEGQPLFTLYAHMSVILVKVNQVVKADDIVGLSGESGVVSGPHVHFEVRVGSNNYSATRNPILWMAPYLDHGVIAGRINYRDGSPVQDATVSLLQKGRVIDTTTTYVMEGTTVRVPLNVKSDDVWGENFVFGDVPAGDYQVVVNVNGLKLSKDVTVRAGTTSGIDLGQVPTGPPTPINPLGTQAP